MLKLIKELYSILSQEYKKKFIVLQFLVSLVAVLEIVSIASIAPFMALVGNLSVLDGENILATVYRYFSFTSSIRFAMALGCLTLLLLSVSACLSIFTTWRLSMFATEVGADISHKLYSFYISRPWIYHANVSSSELTKKIASDTAVLTSGILLPFMQIFSKTSLAFILSLAVFVYNPMVALAGSLVFSVSYYLLYRFVRGKLLENGRVICDVGIDRYRLINEGFGGIKEVILLGRQGFFRDQFLSCGNKIARCQGMNSTLVAFPRSLMELVAFGSIIFLVIFYLHFYAGDLGKILPILSLYALTGFKLLPAFQQVYSNLAVIKSNTPAFDAIKGDLFSIRDGFNVESVTSAAVAPKSEIALRGINFSYDGEKLILKDINLSFPVNKTIGFVGPSGSGKSTLADIFLGLLDPQSGSVLVDGVSLDQTNTRAWQSGIGFVSQSTFLSEGTIAENIAFGLPKEKIDYHAIEKAVKIAQLEDVVRNAPSQLETRIGERGVKLSGGQRQRIGIARAVYHDAHTLVFDEATSSLDGISEKLIMRALRQFSHNKTIVLIAHRLKTLRECDLIVVVDDGAVVDCGGYDELVGRNDMFRRMAELA